MGLLRLLPCLFFLPFDHHVTSVIFSLLVYTLNLLRSLPPLIHFLHRPCNFWPYFCVFQIPANLSPSQPSDADIKDQPENGKFSLGLWLLLWESMVARSQPSRRTSRSARAVGPHSKNRFWELKEFSDYSNSPKPFPQPQTLSGYSFYFFFLI